MSTTSTWACSCTAFIRLAPEGTGVSSPGSVDKKSKMICPRSSCKLVSDWSLSLGLLTHSVSCFFLPASGHTQPGTGHYQADFPQILRSLRSFETPNLKTIASMKRCLNYIIFLTYIDLSLIKPQDFCAI